MNGVNKTLYIPLYGKSQVSRKGIILSDKKAEEIWDKESFPLKGKSKSKWLAYYMAMRARVFDEWAISKMKEYPDAAVLHIGCGMDSRYIRTGCPVGCWYDIDFPDVIAERRKYYTENESYHMLCADASQTDWIEALPDKKDAVVILEGISMYLKNDEVKALFAALERKFSNVSILMDVYTVWGARASKYKNPINEVGVTCVYGIDDPKIVLSGGRLAYKAEHSMTPAELVNCLSGFEKSFFAAVLAGKASKKIYRLFEYET